MNLVMIALAILVPAQVNAQVDNQIPTVINQPSLSCEEDFWLGVLANEFRETVSLYSPPDDYQLWANSQAGQMMSAITPNDCPELFVFADRNPERQLVFLGYYLGNGRVIELGWDKISTGDPRHGKDYHFTPCGVFINTTDNFSYRAQGTRNSRGWRGYGKKGMRVWDFGWQWTTKNNSKTAEPRIIRLLMHATDPDLGEPKLGTIQSKGCVRISQAFNELLDSYGVLDRSYLESLPSPRISAILSKKLVATGLEGRFLLVADSGQIE